MTVQNRAIGALMLRDMRTRVGRTFFGLAFVILGPLAQLVFLMSVYMLLRGRTALMGTSPAVFWATGLLPYILCLYPARTMMRSIVENRPLLSFPIIKPIDLVVARGLVDIITCFWVTAIFCLILLAFGVDLMPARHGDAIAAIFATIYLGFSLGFFGAIAFKLFRPTSIIMMISFMVMYFSSGVFFMPTLMPPSVQDILWFNPLLHCVEWLRSAYYEGYGYGLLNRTYLFSYSTLVLFLGLVLERAARGRMLTP